MTNNNDSGIIDFSKMKEKIDTAKKEPVAPDFSTEEVVGMGLEVFNNEIEGARGFISIIFNSEDQPKFIWSGDLDVIKVIGSFEIAKQQLLADATSCISNEDVIDEE